MRSWHIRATFIIKNNRNGTSELTEAPFLLLLLHCLRLIT